MLAAIEQKARWIFGGLLIGFVVFAAGWLVRHGGEMERAKNAVEAANDATASAQANGKALERATEAGDQHARDAHRLQGEAHAGRIEIQNAPGADTLIEPGLGQRVLCRIERVRGDPASEPCRTAPLPNS